MISAIAYLQILNEPDRVTTKMIFDPTTKVNKTPLQLTQQPNLLFFPKKFPKKFA